MAPDIADPTVTPTSHQCSSSNTSTTSSTASPSVVQQRIVSSSTKANLVSSKDDNNNQIEPKPNASSEEFRSQIRWPDFFAQLFLHLGGLIGLWYLVTLQTKLYTALWSKLQYAQMFADFFIHAFIFSALALVWASGLGITAGAHRLWSHKSYKAKWPLRLLLMFLFTICGQVSEEFITKSYDDQFQQLNLF